MKIKIKKLHPDAVIPKYAKEGDAGMDLTVVNIEYDPKFNQFTCDTGLAFEIPSGYVGLLFPRSSICKKELILSNSVGIIDSGYRGSVSFVFNDKLDPDVEELEESYYNIGDRVGQIIIIPYPQIEFEEVDELSNTERGAGGYGSSGN